MNIRTKYDIGHVFYQPRSRKRTEYIERLIDGETWFKRYEFFEPYVKTRRIFRILSDVINDNAQIKYFCEDWDTYGDWTPNPLRLYLEEEVDRGISTYDRAYEIAQDYAIHKKREYHG